MNTTVKPLVWSSMHTHFLHSWWEADTPFGPIYAGGEVAPDESCCNVYKTVPPSEERVWTRDVDLVDDLQPNGEPVTFESRLMEARNEAEAEFAAKIRECLAPVSPSEDK